MYFIPMVKRFTTKATEFQKQNVHFQPLKPGGGLRHWVEKHLADATFARHCHDSVAMTFSITTFAVIWKCVTQYNDNECLHWLFQLSLVGWVPWCLWLTGFWSTLVDDVAMATVDSTVDGLTCRVHAKSIKCLSTKRRGSQRTDWSEPSPFRC